MLYKTSRQLPGACARGLTRLAVLQGNKWVICCSAPFSHKSSLVEVLIWLEAAWCIFSKAPGLESEKRGLESGSTTDPYVPIHNVGFRSFKDKIIQKALGTGTSIERESSEW